MSGLQLRDIDVRFGGLQALSGVSMGVEPGECVGVIGPNGAGKTTLFDVISGLCSPQGGRITFDGRDITSLRAHRRAELGIRRSFQNIGLMANETVTTNVLSSQHLGCGYSSFDMLARPWRWRRAERALETSTSSVLTSMHVDPYLDKKASELSFATARHVEIAGLLLANPRLLLLDEPTTGLSTHEVTSLRALLTQRRAHDTSLLVVAHDVGFIMSMCDKVFVMAEGSVIFSGTPEAAQASDIVIDAYLGRK